MSVVRVAFAGVGFMGQVAHLRNIVNRDDCQVVAIAEPRPELARLVAQTYGIPTVYRSHRELAADPDVQGVIASQPHLRNGHLAIPLLRAGKDVFIEKPMAGSLREAEAIQQAAEEGGVHVMVGLMKRYDPSVLAARAQLLRFYENGELGRLQRIRAHCYGGDWIHDAAPPVTTSEPVPNDPDFAPIYPEWMDPEQAAQFQTYLNIIAHNVNLVRYLYPEALTAQTAVAQRNRRLTHTAILSGGDGVIVEIAGGAIRSHRWEEETHFYFERGWLKLTSPSPLNSQARGRVEIYRSDDGNEGLCQEVIPPVDWAFRRQADHFIACLRDRTEPISSGRDTLADMRLMEEIFRTMILV